LARNGGIALSTDVASYRSRKEPPYIFLTQFGSFSVVMEKPYLGEGEHYANELFFHKKVDANSY